MNVLITGVAGFLGAALARALLDRGNHVTGIDNLNNYYDVELKKARLNTLKEGNGVSFLKLDVSRRDDIANLFANASFDLVLHLAAQAGVRHSIENPTAYIDANLVGFGNILEGCRQHDVPQAGVCLLEFGVRRQYETAVCGERPSGSSSFSLCCNKKSERIDGARLFESLWVASHGSSFFYGLWTLGPARYGAFYIHAEHSCR